MKLQGLRAKARVYDDSGFFDTGLLCKDDEGMFMCDVDALLKDPITDKEINDLFGVSEETVCNINIYLDEIINYWKDALPETVDYAEMVGAPEWAYGINYVYEDPEGYYIESTIAALEELKNTRKFIAEMCEKMKK